jgi:diguanylate cyclase (GGDEF)-like protein/PAS domain S-box-containing protein
MIVFTVLTIMLLNRYFDGMPMESYRKVWFINIIPSQVSGIFLIFVMNRVYNGLEKQAREIRKSQESLLESETKQRTMIANISDIIAIVNEKGFPDYISSNIEQKCGYIIEEFLDKPIWDNFHPEDRIYVKNEIEALCKNDRAERKMEARCIAKDGTVGNIEMTAVNLMKDIHIKGILINFHDITEHKTREEKIVYLNYHDVLTGLGNRRFFDEQKSRMELEGQLPLSLIIGDINGLKLINDSLGHAEGDKVLKNIAHILKNHCCENDILARVGGDEFIIMLPRTSNEGANDIVTKINQACEEYNKKLSSELYYTSISLGYATKTNVNETLDSIEKIAEDNMYKRKLLEDRSLHSAIVASMKTTLHAKSQETEEHAQRLVKLSKAVGRVIGLNDNQFDDLELLAALHDIGKIGIDDQILNKPGKLTEAEWSEMKKHTEIGYRIAMSSPELMPIAQYILAHHERFDGKGYPQGLSGENIPLLSRIIAVVDAYDAMTEDRIYRKGMSKEEAIEEIIRNAGTQFDPDIVKIFIEIMQSNVLK